MLDVNRADDRLHIIMAAQTVLALNQEQLSIDFQMIQQLSEDIVRKARWFKGIAEGVQEDPENKRKMWGMMLQRLEDKALVDSYLNAKELKLEQEFIDLLLNEIMKREIDISRFPLPLQETKSTSS